MSGRRCRLPGKGFYSALPSITCGSTARTFPWTNGSLLSGMARSYQRHAETEGQRDRGTPAIEKRGAPQRSTRRTDCRRYAVGSIVMVGRVKVKVVPLLVECRV